MVTSIPKYKFGERHRPWFQGSFELTSKCSKNYHQGNNGVRRFEGKLRITDAVERYLNKVNERNTELNIGEGL